MSGGKREYKDARNKKREDIQRSLAHRSNLKRKYFKLLEKQGEQVPDKPSTEHNPKPITYGQRADAIRKRKQEKRKETLDSIVQERENFKARRQAQKETKEKVQKRLSKKTKRGQPLMGPRINGLLDKIKQDKQDKQ